MNEAHPLPFVDRALARYEQAIRSRVLLTRKRWDKCGTSLARIYNDSSSKRIASGRLLDSM